jgi:hypothetical protein
LKAAAAMTLPYGTLIPIAPRTTERFEAGAQPRTCLFTHLFVQVAVKNEITFKK